MVQSDKSLTCSTKHRHMWPNFIYGNSNEVKGVGYIATFRYIAMYNSWDATQWYEYPRNMKPRSMAVLCNLTSYSQHKSQQRERERVQALQTETHMITTDEKIKEAKHSSCEWPRTPERGELICDSVHLLRLASQFTKGNIFCFLSRVERRGKVIWATFYERDGLTTCRQHCTPGKDSEQRRGSGIYTLMNAHSWISWISNIRSKTSFHFETEINSSLVFCSTNSWTELICESKQYEIMPFVHWLVWFEHNLWYIYFAFVQFKNTASIRKERAKLASEFVRALTTLKRMTDVCKISSRTCTEICRVTSSPRGNTVCGWTKVYRLRVCVSAEKRTFCSWETKHRAFYGLPKLMRWDEA